MKAFFVAGMIGLASICLAVAIYKRAVPLIELKPENLFRPAKAMAPPPAKKTHRPLKHRAPPRELENPVGRACG
jgi:hypothetical protein